MNRFSMALVLLLFWAAWFTLVVASNACDGLKALGVLPGDWPFASGNFELTVRTTAIYAVPRSAVAALFVGVIAWECLAAALFWRALIGRRNATTAFSVAVGLFAMFALADEGLIAFPSGIENTHLLVLVALVVSWLAVRGDA
ncbi:MAG TPA: hypothetical protein VHZ24_12115 [Pirellulales bacterium]|jgi:hypothetical protein|nr:hypothetical protein [Pirellulales bacterium]